MEGKDIIQIDLKIREHFKKGFDAVSVNTSFDQVEHILKKGAYTCHFLKKSENKYLFVIPVSQLEGQVEFLVEYNGQYFDIITNRKGKASQFNSSVILPNYEYSFSKKCTFKFIQKDEVEMDFSVLVALRELNSQLSNLTIESKQDFSTQREIWAKYIKAKQLLINKLQEPMQCVGSAEIYPNPDDIIEEPNKYKIEINLRSEKADEYRQLEETLSDKLHIETHIDANGSCFLTLDDIFRGLDPVIKKYYQDTIVREKKINCILAIRPYLTSETLQNKYSRYMDIGLNSVNTYVLEVSNLKVPIIQAEEILKNEGYYMSGCGVYFEILDYDDILSESILDKYHVTIQEDKYKPSKAWDKPEIVLPKPNGNTFSLHYSNESDPSNRSEMMYQTLCFIYGKEHVKREAFYKFSCVDKDKKFSSSFGHDEWTEICKDLFAFEDWLTIGESVDGKTIHFDFETKEEFLEKYNMIDKSKSFAIKKSPLDSDFKFKVNTSIISEKSLKQLFDEKLEKLSGAEFVVDKSDYNGRAEYQFIGKLIPSESNAGKLVLYIPNYFNEDKVRAKQLIKFWKKNPKFGSIHADLRGDAAKTQWLDAAMDKLGDIDGWSLNNKPINKDIKDFIFDSSKAKPIELLESNDIEEMPEYQNFDKTSILKLNDSQKKSVLRGLLADDLCMLQGPPGTGKTTVIAELIWQLVRTAQDSRILLTSETNLAVDNALEKLMNEKNINPSLSRYITLIKPIRFGKTEKFEEEGKRYSIERIEKWVDNLAEFENDYDNEGLEDNEEDEEEILNNDENVVSLWMYRIANRQQDDEFKYNDVLEEWRKDLCNPDVDAKRRFKDMYLRHANVIGSTCSSTGSPGFQKDYLTTFLGLSKEQLASVRTLNNKLGGKESDINYELIVQALAKLDLDVELRTQKDLLALKETLQKLYTVKFDTVIMDEASKATPPELLQPLCYAQKSIIIGDHRQLPPMLNEKSFREALLDLKDTDATKLSEEIDRDFVETSQFKRLILNPNVSPTIKSTFNLQYRMHQYINDVISQFYESDECGGLKCGLDPARMDSEDLTDVQSRYHGFSYPGFISPDIHTIWINVDEPEENDGTSKVNITEIEAIKKVLSLLKKAAGFNDYMAHWDYYADDDFRKKEEKEIGIISFYGKQVKKMQESVRPLAKELSIPIRLKTVDKFQGMERNIIIVSTVRSNKNKKINGFVTNNSDAGFAKSPERLNVALSRARRLLIVVGNKSFFSGIKDNEGKYLYRNAINVIEKNGLVIDYNDLKKL